MRTWRGVVALASVLVVGLGHARAAQPHGHVVSLARGALVFAGGELRFDNAAVWRRFIDLAGGRGAGVVVVPAAATNPEKSGRATVENFRRYGARAEMVPIAPRLHGADCAHAARDPANVSLLRHAGGIWFVGGDQQRITHALCNPDGTKTPTLEAIWDAYRGGAVIGGTSAGAAIMSRVMFANAMSALDTIKYGITRGVQVGPGLGFLGADWFVDQHFLARGRLPRALEAMRDFGFKYGIGVDEDTAVVFKDGRFDVVGYHGALVMDVSGAEIDHRLPAFNMKKVKLTYLDAGDGMDAATRLVHVSQLKIHDRKIDPRAKDFSPYYYLPEDFYFSDMLGAGAVYLAMCRALDSRPGMVTGVAFGQPAGGRKNDLGFEFKVYRGDDTVGWYTAAGGNETWTVLNAYVDITPVRLARPLYTPLKK
jgi:cyanophycinase